MTGRMEHCLIIRTGESAKENLVLPGQNIIEVVGTYHLIQLNGMITIVMIQHCDLSAKLLQVSGCDDILFRICYLTN